MPESILREKSGLSFNEDGSYGGYSLEKAGVFLSGNGYATDQAIEAAKAYAHQDINTKDAAYLATKMLRNNGVNPEGSKAKQAQYRAVKKLLAAKGENVFMADIENVVTGMAGDRAAAAQQLLRDADHMANGVNVQVSPTQEIELSEDQLAFSNHDPIKSLTDPETLDNVQLGLSGAGLTPKFGIIPDLLNAGISTLRGNLEEAGLGLASAVPVTGQVSGAALFGLRLGKKAKKAAEAADNVSDIGSALGLTKKSKNFGSGLEKTQHAKEGLGELTQKFGLKEGGILKHTQESGERFKDTKTDNINVFAKRPDGKEGFIRVTIDPKEKKIVSARLQQERDVVNRIKKGRDVPITE